MGKVIGRGVFNRSQSQHLHLHLHLTGLSLNIYIYILQVWVSTFIFTFTFNRSQDQHLHLTSRIQDQILHYFSAISFRDLEIHIHLHTKYLNPSFFLSLSVISVFFSHSHSLWRRAALSWIREHGSDQGVIYFADDDNSYDTRIFEEIRKTQWVLNWSFFVLCYDPFWYLRMMYPLKGCVSVPGGSGAEVRGELANLERRKSHRLLWRFPGGTEGGRNFKY